MEPSCWSHVWLTWFANVGPTEWMWTIHIRPNWAQHINGICNSRPSEYDQEIPQSKTADNPMAPQARVTQQPRDTSKINQAKQPALFSPSRWMPWLGWNATITDTHYNFRECLVDLYKAVFRISRVVSRFVSPVPTKSSLSVYCVYSVRLLYSSSSCWMPCGALSLFQPQQSMHRPRDLLIYISCSSMGLNEPIGWLTTSGVTWLFCIQHIND